MLQVLAVTGAIGSGKSLVCRFLAERGFPVYDSDSRTKALYDTDNELLEAVRKKMSAYWTGDGSIPEDFLVGEDGRLDRKALASIIFKEGPSGSTALRDLESVVHPAVLRDFLEWKDSPEERRFCHRSSGGRTCAPQNVGKRPMSGEKDRGESESMRKLVHRLSNNWTNGVLAG